MYVDLHLNLTPAVAAQVRAQLAAIRQLIPNLATYTQEQKKAMPKMGRKRYAFAREAYEFAQMYPQILPQNRSVLTYTTVLTEFELLSPIFKDISALYRSMSDTIKRLGSNTYIHSLATYRAVMDSNNDGEQGISYAREVLSPQFQSQGVENEPEEEEEPIGKAPFVPSDPGGNTGGNAGGNTGGNAPA